MANMYKDAKLAFFFGIAGFFIAFSHAFAPALANDSHTYFQKLTGDDPESDKSRWDNLYRKKKGYVFGRDPAPFLEKNIGLLRVGRALDIAMGEGRNAVFLAKKGFKVEGVDISEVGVRKAKQLARENKVRIKTITTDVNKYQIAPDSYDVILVFYYLPRGLIHPIKQGLKRGGIVVFESHTVDQIRHDKTQNRDYLLAKGELKSMFKDLEIIKYQETDDGKDAVASLIARRP